MHIHVFFFFNDTATTEIYTLSLHDALPICDRDRGPPGPRHPYLRGPGLHDPVGFDDGHAARRRLHPRERSEEHTSELQSQSNLVCRLLLEKNKLTITIWPAIRSTTSCIFIT